MPLRHLPSPFLRRLSQWSAPVFQFQEWGARLASLMAAASRASPSCKAISARRLSAISTTAQKTPATAPVSSRTDVYESVNQVSLG